MSFASLPVSIRAPAARKLLLSTTVSSFHTSSAAKASVLFALSALSNSRETQHFNKLTHLPRLEHSPPLKLIQTSEVDPFPLPLPPKRISVSTPWPRSQRSAARLWDDRALQIGRVLLTDQARRMHRLQRSVFRARRREAKKDAIAARERKAWYEERQKLRNDTRVAGVWILLSIGTATALATWRFWPAREPYDSGEMGRRIAAKASAAIPLPAATSRAPRAVIADRPPPVPSTTIPPAVTTAPAEPLVEAPLTTSTSWWRNLFWKQ